MATLPAVAGLVKHQVYAPDPRTGARSAIVTTFWTWRDEGFPVAPARITYEVGVLAAWVAGAPYRAIVPIQYVTADWIKSWDMGASPPVRATPHRVWPQVLGSAGSQAPPQLCVVIALRTQAVGSSTRNRLNGRIYHGRNPPSFDVGAVWAASHLTNCRTAFNVVLAGLSPGASANSGDWVVPCFFEAGALRVGGPLLPPVDHLLARQDAAVRRSKLYHPGPYAIGT